MARVTVEDCIEKIPNRFDLVLTASQRALRIVSSYHCSRYNTQTGRLTDAMFNRIFADITSGWHAGSG